MVAKWQYWLLEKIAIGNKVCEISAAIIMNRETNRFGVAR